MRPAIQTVHVVVLDSRAVTEDLLAVHAQSLVVQAHVLRFQRWQGDTQKKITQIIVMAGWGQVESLEASKKKGL